MKRHHNRDIWFSPSNNLNSNTKKNMITPKTQKQTFIQYTQVLKKNIFRRFVIGLFVWRRGKKNLWPSVTDWIGSSMIRWNKNAKVRRIFTANDSVYVCLCLCLYMNRVNVSSYESETNEKISGEQDKYLLCYTLLLFMMFFSRW